VTDVEQPLEPPWQGLVGVPRAHRGLLAQHNRAQLIRYAIEQGLAHG